MNLLMPCEIKTYFMDALMLFVDGSVNPQSNIGYGAYLAVSDRGLGLDALRTLVKVRRFEHTSSTKLELQTLLWALGDIHATGRKVMVYTDSQNILGLQFTLNDLVHASSIRSREYRVKWFCRLPGKPFPKSDFNFDYRSTFRASRAGRTICYQSDCSSNRPRPQRVRLHTPRPGRTPWSGRIFRPRGACR